MHPLLIKRIEFNKGKLMKLINEIPLYGQTVPKIISGENIK